MQSLTGIILNYNQKQHLKVLIKNALNQTTPFDEIIIVDDASTDGSQIEIKDFVAKHPKVRIHFQSNTKNLGVIKNMQRATEIASSDFVFFMSTRIQYNTNLVKEFHNCLAQHPEAIMISGNIKLKSNSKEDKILILPFPSSVTQTTPAMILDQLSVRIFTFFGGANFLHTKTILKNKFIIDNLHWHADWFLYLMMSLTGHVAISKKIIATYEVKKNRFSDGMFEKSLQKNVTLLFLDTLLNFYPTFYFELKKRAVLPFYSINTLFVIFNNKKHRSFIKPKLVFRCTSFWTLKRIANLLPRNVSVLLRNLLRY